MTLIYSFSLFACCLSFIQVSFAVHDQDQANSSQEFSPITLSGSFKARYRLEAFDSGNLVSSSEIYEYYQKNLQSSSIWLRRQENFTSNGESNSINRRFLYDGKNKRDFELVATDNLAQSTLDGFYMEETGGSQSYAKTLKIDSSDRWDNIKLLPARNSLDYILFKLTDGQSRQQTSLILSVYPFLTDWCTDEVIRLQLSYIRGLSHLFHVIECRRKEFVKVNETVFEANNLDAMALIRDPYAKSLNVSISVAANSIRDSKESYLPPRALPVSLSLEFGPTKLQINVIQFETIGSGEHLSETGGSKSEFLLPLARGAADLSPVLEASRNQPSVAVESSGAGNPLSQFSFRASLTATHWDGLLADPLELVVAYDGVRRVLARQLSRVDRGQVSLGDTWKKHSTRLVYDADSMAKWHLMDTNDDYATGDEQNNSGVDQWTECSSDSLRNTEAEAMETGDHEAFDAGNGAIYMGMAMVRGIPCNVFERRLNRLPIWLGLDAGEDMSRVNIYSTIYLVASGGILGERKLARLTISVLPEDSGPEMMKFNLDIHSFAQVIGADQLRLFDISQECLLTKQDARYLEMEFEMTAEERDGDTIRLLSSMSRNELLRNQLISRALSQSLGLVVAQQVDLTSSSKQDGSMEARLSVYQLPRARLSVQLIGYARDLVPGSATSGWSLGAMSASLDECQWRAAHTLTASGELHQQGDSSRRMLMYCASSLHCVLGTGTSDWRKLESGQATHIQGVLQFPAHSNLTNKCSVLMVELLLDEFTIGEHKATRASGGLSLDWMLAQKARLQDTQSKLESFEDSCSQLQASMRISRLQLSNVMELDHSGALSKALIGFGYRLPEANGKIDEQVELLLNNGAQCGHLCSMHHECASYSLCHQQHKLQCLLTRVNWTDPQQVAQLHQLAHSPVSSGWRQSTRDQLKVQLADGSLSVAPLRRSPLCSLFPRRQLQLFRLKQMGRLIIRGIEEEDEFLRAVSSEECAKFCLNRAHLLNSMDIGNSSSSAKTAKPQSGRQKPKILVTGLPNAATFDQRPCTSFQFDSKNKLCQLLPVQNSQPEMVPLSDPEADFSGHLINESSVLIQTPQVDPSLTIFSQVDLYELDYEQLFISHQNKRLLVSRLGDNLSLGNSWQTTFVQTSVSDCAKLCAQWRSCRSFDIMLPKPVDATDNDRKQGPIGGNLFAASSESCVLNAFSKADLTSDRKSGRRPQFKVQLVEAEGAEIWWHFEPNELAYYATGKLLVVNNMTEKEQGSIFLENPMSISVAPINLILEAEQQETSGSQRDTCDSLLLSLSIIVLLYSSFCCNNLNFFILNR